MGASASKIARHVTPDAATLIARARAMIPALKARAAQAEADRKVPAETIAEMKEAGFFNVLKPRRWGGYEMDPQVFYEVQMALAEGCMSTAWVYGVVGVHPFELGLFPLKAQEDVWSKDDTVLMSSSYQPVGKVERVDGGFRLSGQWGFSSGSDHCQWVLLGSMIPPTEPGGPPDMRTFLLPRSDYKIIDNWHTFGLKGTGSQGILVENAFVPEHRTHKAIDGFLCKNPGQEVNDGDIFKLPWAQVFVRAVSTASIGAAQGALAAYLDIAAKRVSTNTGKATKADPFAQMAAAKAQVEINEMRTTLTHNFAAMMATIRSGGTISLHDRLMYRFQSSAVSSRCAEIIDQLVVLLGGRAIYLDSPIIRTWLDLNAARAHVANTPSLVGVPLGASYMGEEIREFFI
ncbi:MAG: acyl-CoA dehydrogenase family protein [Rhodospirillaceae bacterium]|nr:acyl-CoA dehydrogenase family protein [Rhodospirillaceae bacterium]